MLSSQNHYGETAAETCIVVFSHLVVILFFYNRVHLAEPRCHRSCDVSSNPVSDNYVMILSDD